MSTVVEHTGGESSHSRMAPRNAAFKIDEKSFI